MINSKRDSNQTGKIVFLVITIHLTQYVQGTNDRTVKIFSKYYCHKLKGLFIAPSAWHAQSSVRVHALASGDVHMHRVPLYFSVISRVKSQLALSKREIRLKLKNLLEHTKVESKNYPFLSRLMHNTCKTHRLPSCTDYKESNSLMNCLPVDKLIEQNC